MKATKEIKALRRAMLAVLDDAAAPCCVLSVFKVLEEVILAGTAEADLSEGWNEALILTRTALGEAENL